jgi:hypothetical protein
VQRPLLSASLLVLALFSSVAQGQDWARKMFTESSHDFGTVARGAKVEYRFKFTNPYVESVHVSSVSSSCGCTTPTAPTAEIKTHETGEIVAAFNTRSTYLGNHSATLTVQFDKPFAAIVQLNVWGDIRSDLSVQPESVELGTIDQGQEVERKLTVTHNGSSDWKILDVRSVNTNYEVEVKNGAHNGGQVSYDLLVHLKKDAPPGYVKDQLILVTNDQRVTQFPIEVEGLVKAELSASPQSITFGVVEAGKTAKSQTIVVRGRRPFKVTGVQCDDESFTFKPQDASSTVQLITVSFTAPDKPGKIAKKVRIETDLGKGFIVELVAQAEVKASEPAIAGSDKGAPEKTTAEKTTPDKAAPVVGEKSNEKSDAKIASPKGTTEKPSATKTTADGAKLDPVADAGKSGPAINDPAATDPPAKNGGR